MFATEQNRDDVVEARERRRAMFRRCARWPLEIHDVYRAGLRMDALTAPWCLDGAMDGEAFKTYLETQLAATLRPGDIVIADNLPAHKVAGVSEIVEQAGATITYLPPYSPDLNPIEQVFAKLKKLLRKAMARSYETL